MFKFVIIYQKCMLQQFKLIEKKNLTPNVYEMVFSGEKELIMKPGQFITFLLDKIWGRAYSILKMKWKELVLIIKKRELKDGWRWWSKLICELNIWDSLKWVWPAGHFLLKENTQNKLFIGTWTWFVPLYNMILWELEKNNSNKLYFTFWVREKEDVFYIEELEKIKNKYPNFDYGIYISRVKDLHIFELKYPNSKILSWYTTNYLTKKNLDNIREYYICWAPMMIESTVKKLINLWFKEKENIFYEKY